MTANLELTDRTPIIFVAASTAPPHAGWTPPGGHFCAPSQRACWRVIPDVDMGAFELSGQRGHAGREVFAEGLVRTQRARK
jgi:hypothetical protein